MSRHRNVRNLASEAYEDDYGEEEEMETPTVEQLEQRDEAAAAVLEIIGHNSGISLKEIQETVWYYFFDVEKSVNYLLEKITKHKEAEEKKAKVPKEKEALKRPGSIPPLESLLKSSKTIEISAKGSSLSQMLTNASASSGKPSMSIASPSGLNLKSLGSLSGAIKPFGLLSTKPPSLMSLSTMKSTTAKPTLLHSTISSLMQDKESEPSLSIVSARPLDTVNSSITFTDDEESNDILANPLQTEKDDTAPEMVVKSPSAFATNLASRTVSSKNDIATAQRVAALTRQINMSFLAPSFIESDQLKNPSRKETLETKKNKKNENKKRGLMDASAESVGFSSPSPDDVVLRAQSQRASKGSVSQKAAVPISVEPVKVTQAVDTEKHDHARHAKQRKIPLNDIKTLMQAEADAKPNLNLVIVGHVDAGKSTLVGHLLYLLGEVDSRTMKKYEHEANKIGKGSFAFAWVLDATDEERSRGITMDVAVNQFDTPNRRFTILDAPGHKDFVPKMISGASQADVAILVIDASIGEFEAGFQSNGQTKEHAMLVRSLGVQQIVVAINKLDMVSWSKDRFDEISNILGSFLHQSGFHKNNVFFVPCSGLTGENLLKRSSEIPTFDWYQGPTLVDQIDRLGVPDRPIDKPFRFTVADVFRAGYAGGVTLAGRIESGYVCVGEELVVMPGHERARVKRMPFFVGDSDVFLDIELNDDRKEWAVAGQSASILVDGIDETHVAVGSVLCPTNDVIPVTSTFRAQIVVFDLTIPIIAGFTGILYCHNTEHAAWITKLVAQCDKTTGEVTKKNPRVLPKMSAGIVDITTSVPICVETFKDFRSLGRITFRKDGATVAAGIVTEV